MQKVQALHVVHEIGHANLDPRSGKADGSDEQTHAILLFGEDVFDTGADFRFGIIGPAYRFRHRLALGLLAVNMADKAIAGDECLILL